MENSPETALQSRPRIPGALATLDDQLILQRISNGERASHIAAELGVHKSALTHRYADNRNYQIAKSAGQEIRLDECERLIELSRDNFNLARAREMFRAAAWRAEREFPDRWGVKQTGGAQVNVQIVVEKPGGGDISVIAAEQQNV